MYIWCDFEKRESGSNSLDPLLESPLLTPEMSDVRGPTLALHAAAARTTVRIQVGHDKERN